MIHYYLQISKDTIIPIFILLTSMNFFGSNYENIFQGLLLKNILLVT